MIYVTLFWLFLLSVTLWIMFTYIMAQLETLNTEIIKLIDELRKLQERFRS